MPDQELSIVIRIRDFVSRNLTRINRTLDRWSKRMSSTLNRVRSAVFNLRSAFAALAVGAVAKGAIDAFTRQEKAIAGMEQVMRSMGRFTPTLSASIQDLASEIQKVGVSGDEATIEGAKFLLTYKQITDDLLPDAIRTMADLSALTGQDMAASANILGKAAMGLTGMLARYGITLSDTAKKSKDFELILREIQEQVGGQQRALRKTGFGGLKAFENALGDLQEKLGQGLVQGARPFLETFAERMPAILDSLGQMTSLSELIFEGLKGVLSAVGNLGTAFEVLKGGLLAIKVMGARVLSFLASAFASTFEEIVANFELIRGNPIVKWLLGEEGVEKWEITLDNASQSMDKFAQNMAKAAESALDEIAELTDPTRLKPHERMNQLLGETEAKYKAIAEAAKRAAQETQLAKDIEKLLNELTKEDEQLASIQARVDAILDSRNATLKTQETIAGLWGGIFQDIESANIAAAGLAGKAAKAATASTDLARQSKLVSTNYENVVASIKEMEEVGRREKFVKSMRKVQALTQSVGDMLADRVVSLTRDWVEGELKPAREILKGILADLGQMILQEALRGLVRAGVSAAFSAFGKGGVTPGPVTRVANVGAFQEGGIVRTPTLAAIAERGQPEAVVPLPDGRRIPVQLRGTGTDGRGGATIVNINVSAVDARSVEQFLIGNRRQVTQAVAMSTREGRTGRKQF